jgi:hypothetical protein
MPFRVSLLVAFLLVARLPAAPVVVVAEGERFKPLDSKGWKVTHQDDTYGSHTYGGMWMTHGGCLGAPANGIDSVAVQTVTIPAAGKYRVWSKYQAPPYFNYLHRIEVHQGGKMVYSAEYGKTGTPRLWSFSGESDELWWFWGVDHDAAEAPKQLVSLAAGQAEVRLVALKNPAPAGARFIDFVVLTTNPADDYDGFKPYKVGSPFTNEALAATRLFLRFRNPGTKPAELNVSRAGHYQPNDGGATTKVPGKPVPAGQWSVWHNIGPFCRLVHDEGLTLTLPEGGSFAVEFARDEAGKDLVGALTVTSGEAVVVPIDITWRKDARVKLSRALAEEILTESKKWRRANGGKKPEKVLFYGAFGGPEPWVWKLKDTLGYNTNLPDAYSQVKRAFVAAHHGSPDAIRTLAKMMSKDQKDRLRVISFGDEISLGKINYADPKMQAKFRAWLAKNKITAADLGVPLDKVTLSDKPGRLAWYSNLFNEEERFADYRAMTELVQNLFGKEVLTGANYSPHHLALCYGPIYQWVDIFKHRGMGMMWSEDYIFSVPEVPQILSWMFGQMRCAVKYHRQPIHFYVMPHAPGQEPGFLRRNTLLSVGFGASHIDNFWIAPAERFTENYVAWGYKDSFRAISESIFDTAEAEKYQSGGKVRPARVALVIGKATDFNESRRMVDKSADAFLKRCRNAPAQVNQILCRKDQQYLYLALRHAQHAVDLVTEDDIADGILKDYQVVYFAGEWIDRRAVKKLDEWVSAGGTLYATAGLGHRNEFDEADDGLLKLLGLKGVKTTRNTVAQRTLLELPLAEPIDTLTIGDKKIAALGMKQVLTPGRAKVIGVWSDGSGAVTEYQHGKGRAFAVGTLAGASWMQTGLRRIPFARGGRGTVYNPTGFTPQATALVGLGVELAKPDKAVECGIAGVEGVVIDHPDGTLVTLVNWTNGPIAKLPVSVRLSAAPKSARSVTGQTALPVKYADGRATFTVDLKEGDFILLPRK